MKRVLVLASVASMIDQFNIPNIKLLQEMGYQVDVACNFIEGSSCTDEKIKMLLGTLNDLHVNWYQIDFARNITNIRRNVKAFKQVKRLLKDKHYTFIHCHSPIGGVMGRIAGKITKTKLVYTAHGFHFYKGAPIKNWLLYYPVEKLCSYFTDVLICINKEDYELAKKKMKAKKIEYVPGIGIDLKKFEAGTETNNKRAELSIPDKKIWVLSVGELIPRKNHETLIRAVADFEDVFLTIAGKGDLFDYYQQIIKELKVEDRVKLLGFRTDISELCKSADIFAFPSLQEGLPLALMEAMACGKPVLCSNIGCNTELIEGEKGGYLFDPNSIDDIEKALSKIKLRNLVDMGTINASVIRKSDLSEVMKDSRKQHSEISGKGYEELEKLVSRFELRASIGTGNEAILLLSVGELNKNKNHEVVIKMMADTSALNNLHYAIAGKGYLEQSLVNLAKDLQVNDRVHLLGFCSNVRQWYRAADLFVFPSFREGLSVSLMEAMACGLPCIVSNIRGNSDLIDNNGGLLFNPKSSDDLKKSITEILKYSHCRKNELRKYNQDKIRVFGLENVTVHMKRIYDELVN